MQTDPTEGGGAPNWRSRNRLVWAVPPTELVARSSLLSLPPFPRLIASLCNIQNNELLTMKTKYASKYITNLKTFHEFEKAHEFKKDHRLKNVHGF